MNVGEKLKHINEEKLNNQGSLMRIVKYIDNRNIVVEFQDDYKAKVCSTYGNFKCGSIKNPYYPTVHGIGIIGTKYPRQENFKNTKEYEIWKSVLCRCYDNKTKNKQPTYNNAQCCKEWLNFENFYEWLHNQPNFDKWKTCERWAIDKDILCKGNKFYSPDMCCLVPQNVNCLFLKREARRGKYPIGVRYREGYGFVATCRNPFLNKAVELGCFSTPEKAFEAYKSYKEKIIKQVAEIEYKNGNITKDTYEAMMNYEVEITD